MPEEKSTSLANEKVIRPTIAPARSSGKQLGNRVSNTFQEMAEYAWRYARADVNHKAHGRSNVPGEPPA